MASTPEPHAALRPSKRTNSKRSQTLRSAAWDGSRPATLEPAILSRSSAGRCTRGNCARPVGAPARIEGLVDESDERDCQAMPACTATRVAAVREETCSFAKMWLRWRSTVFSLSTSAAAISRLLWASATRRRTSTSRLVRPPKVRPDKHRAASAAVGSSSPTRV